MSRRVSMTKQSQPTNIWNNIQHHWPPENSNKIHNETPFHPGRKGRVTSAGGDVDKWKLSTGDGNSTGNYGNQREGHLEKAINGSSSDRPGSFPKTPLFKPCIFVEVYSLKIVIICRHKKIPWRGVKCPDLIITALTCYLASFFKITVEQRQLKSGCRQTNHTGDGAEGTVVLFGNQP